MLDIVLMLGKAVDGAEPTFPVVLGHDVGGGADLAGDVVLNPRPGVGGARRLDTVISWIEKRIYRVIHNISPKVRA